MGFFGGGYYPQLSLEGLLRINILYGAGGYRAKTENGKAKTEKLVEKNVK